MIERKYFKDKVFLSCMNMETITCGNCIKPKPAKDFSGLTQNTCTTCYGVKVSKAQLRKNFNKHNKSIKQCSKCLHKKARTKFNKIKTEDDVGLCEECAIKNGGGGKAKNTTGHTKQKDELAAKFQVSDDNIDLKRYEIRCTKCNKIDKITKMPVIEFTKVLCEDCKDIFVKKDDKLRKKQAKEFNQKYNDVRMCTICYWIKKIEKFQGAKTLVERCDSCRRVPAITSSNYNKKELCVDCGLTKTLKEFEGGMAGRCKECQLEKWRKANHKKMDNVDEYNATHTTMRQCKRCLKKLKLTEFNGYNVNCKKCCKDNEKYEETRDKNQKKQSDKERYENIRKEAMEYNRDDWSKCYNCGFEGSTTEHFTTKIGNVVKYCLNKCYKHRVRAEEKRKDTRHQGAEVAHKIYGIKKVANKNKQVWQIDEKLAKELVYQACFYCQYLPTETQLNSIDSVVHDKGFIDGNVVPCCEICNRAKGNRSLMQFIKRAQHITSYKFPEKYQWKYMKYFPDTISQRFKQYRNNAKSDGKKFKLNYDEFMIITKKACHYCGKRNTQTHRNGIDRKNSSKEIGYTIENCVSACTTCNFMKHTCPYDEFLDKMERIATNPRFIIKK